MRRKVVERYIKNAMKTEAPDRIWNNLNKLPLSGNRVQKKARPAFRYPIISCAAVCVMVVLLVAVYQQGFWKRPPITGAPTLNTDSSATETENKTSSAISPVSSDSQRPAAPPLPAVSKAPEETETPPTVGAESVPIQEIPLPKILLYNGRLYQLKRDVKVKAEELDKITTETINGGTERIYSLCGKALASAFVLQRDNVYHYYECIFTGVFSFQGKKYQLADIVKSGQQVHRGRYLGEAVGCRLYQIDGDSNRILLDASALLGGDEEDCLYSAIPLE